MSHEEAPSRPPPDTDTSLVSQDITVFLLAGPVLCGKTTFLNEISPNILDITALISHRLGYRHAIDISLVLRLLGYNTMGLNKVSRGLEDITINGKTMTQRICMRDGISDEEILLLLSFSPLIKSLAIDSLAISDRINKITKYLKTIWSNNTSNNYKNMFFEVIRELQNEKVVMTKTDTMFITIRDESLQQEIQEQSFKELKYIIREERGKYDAFAWESLDLSEIAYSKALQIIFSVGALDDDISDGKSNKYLARFVRYGHEIPTISLKALIKRNICRFLTEGVYVPMEYLLKSINKSTSLLSSIKTPVIDSSHILNDSVSSEPIAVVTRELSPRTDVFTITSSTICSNINNHLYNDSYNSPLNFNSHLCKKQFQRPYYQCLRLRNIENTISFFNDCVMANYANHTLTPILRRIRRAIAPHTIDIRMTEWDHSLIYILRNYIFRAYPRPCWSRLVKLILAKDLNETSPYDGSAGYTADIFHNMKLLLDYLHENDVINIFTILDSTNQSGITDNSSLIHMVTEIPLQWNLIHHAASINEFHAMNFEKLLVGLIQRGMSINTVDSNGYSPLHVACAAINIETCLILVQYGASITITNKSNKVPILLLMESIARSNYTWTTRTSSNRIIKALEVLIPDHSFLWTISNSLLSYCILYTDEVIAREIISRCYSCSSRYWRHDLIKSIAIKSIIHQRFSIAEYLMEAFHDVLLRPSDNDSFWTHLQDYLDTNIINIINKSGVGRDLGLLLLYLAVRGGNVGCVQYLLMKGLSVSSQCLYPSQLLTSPSVKMEDTSNISTYTALLHIGVVRSRVTLLQLLLKDNLSSFVTSTVPTSIGIDSYYTIFSPLCLACISNKNDILQQLLRSLPKRLTVQECVSSSALSPLVACVIGSNSEGLVLLQQHMGIEQFALAVYARDRSGYSVLDMLIFLVKYKSLHIDKTFMIQPNNLLKIFHFVLKCGNNFKQTVEILLLNNSSNTSSIVSLQDKSGRINVWNKRLDNLKAMVVAIDDSLNSILSRLSLVPSSVESTLQTPNLNKANQKSSNGEHHSVVALSPAKLLIQSSCNRWKTLDEELSDNKFIIGIRILTRLKKPNRQWCKLAQCIHVILNRNTVILSEKEAWNKLVQLLHGSLGQSTLASKVVFEHIRNFCHSLKSFANPFIVTPKSPKEDEDNDSLFPHIHTFPLVLAKESLDTILKIYEVTSDKSIPYYGSSSDDHAYYSALRRSSEREGKHMSEHVIDALKVLFRWVDTIISDSRVVHTSLNKSSLYDSFFAVNLLNKRNQIEGIISNLNQMISSVSSVDKVPLAPYMSVLRMTEMLVTPACVSTVTDCIHHLRAYIKANNFDGVIDGEHPLCHLVGVGETLSLIGGMKRLNAYDYNEVLEDILCLVIERRSDLIIHNQSITNNDVCPLLSLCSKGMWRAAYLLLQSWIDDGVEIATSLYPVYHPGGNQSKLLQSCRDAMTRKVDESNNLWQDIDISQVYIVTPLHFAIAAGQTQFIQLLIHNYPNYSVSTDILAYAVDIGRAEIAFYITANAGVVYAPPLTIASSVDQEESDELSIYKRKNMNLHTKMLIIGRNFTRFMGKILRANDHLSVIVKNRSFVVSSVTNKSAISLYEASREYGIQPQFEGLYRGLFLNSKGNVVLMNGNSIPIDEFCADVRYLSLALPMPLCACGLNNSGATILSKSTSLPSTDSDDNYGVDINAQLIAAGAWRSFALDMNGSYPVYNAIIHGKLELALSMIRACTSLTVPHINDLHCKHTAMSSSLKMDHLYNRPALKAIKEVESEYFSIIENMNSTSTFTASLGLLTFAFSRLESLRIELLQKDFLKYLQVSHSSDGAILDTIVKAKQILSIIGITSSSLISTNSENSPEIANQGSARASSTPVNLFQALESVGPDSIVDLLPFDTTNHLSNIITSWFYNRSKLHSKQYHQTVLLGNTLGLYHRWDISCIDVGLYGYDAACQQSTSNNKSEDKKKKNLKIHVDTPDGFKLLSRQLSLETSLLHKTVESNFHSMEMFLKSLKYDLQAVQDALLSSYTIIEFGRWLLLARVLTTLTAPTNTSKTSSSYGSRVTPHPLAQIHRKLVFAKQNQSKIEKHMSTLLTSSQHSLIVDGLNSRLRIVDNIDVLGFRTFLFFKQSMSSRFTTLRGLTLRGLQLVFQLTNDTNSSNFIHSLLTTPGITHKSVTDSAVTVDQLLQSMKNVHLYHAVNIDSITFEESRDKEQIFYELEALLIKVNEVLLRVEDSKTDITKSSPAPVGIRPSKQTKSVSSSVAQNYFDITIHKTELDAVDNIFHSMNPEGSTSSTGIVNSDIIVSYFADTRGRDSSNINTYLRDKFTGQYGMKQVKEIVKGDLTVCYETLTVLLNLLQSIIGLYHRRALYHLDVSYKVGRHKSDGKVFLALCTPHVFLNEQVDKRRDTNSDIDMLWLKNDSHVYQHRLQLSRLLLQLQLSPYPTGTESVDLVQSPIVLAAVFGADELLADILNYCDENQHQVGNYKEVTYHKSLLWHVLMAYPSKKSISSLYERYLYHSYTAGGDTTNNSKILGYERCVRLLLDRDFAAYKPDGAYYSCADLAALKQLPSELILQLFHQEKEPLRSSNTQFNILHFCILMDQNDISNNLLTELLQQDAVANPSATLDMNNIFPPAVVEDIEMHSYFVSLHLPPASAVGVAGSSRMSDEERNEVIHNRTKASFIASLLAFIAGRKNKELLSEIDKNSIMRRRHIDPLWVALAKACSNLWSSSLQAMVTTATSLPPWMSLVNKSQNTSIVTDNLWSYLHLAVAANNLYVLEMLLDLMGHNGQAMSGTTATSLIQYSCFYNNITVLQLLCDFGAMHCATTSCHFHPLHRSITPLEIALQYSVKCMTYLLANGVSITHKQVLDSLMQGYLNEECTVILINHLHTVNPSEIGLMIKSSPTNQSDKLIHILCRRGYQQVIERLLLLNYPIDLDEPDITGYSPMHIAILLGQKNVTRLLSMSIIDPLYQSKGNKYMYYGAIIKRRVRKYLQRRALRE